MIKRILQAACLTLWLPSTLAAGLDPAAVEVFVSEMASEHAFDPASLRALLGQAQRLDTVLATISKPAEYKPWHVYRPIFLTEARIAGGRQFRDRHAAALAAAAASSGVPPEVIVAIIGVETSYGQHAGSHRVLESLSTLAFHYPPRAPFFRGELRNFLLLSREEGLDPASLKGSYAGAMGIPQFMPSSFRAYAVDFDGDGRRDIWSSPTDAIGSVANYLKVHGWEAGKPVACKALEAVGNARVASSTVELTQTFAELAAQGVRAEGNVPPEEPAVLLSYEGPTAPEYWLGFSNFHAITRYNRSPKYALAVFQLAEEIQQQQGGAGQ